MSRRSPTIEGFKLMFRRPSLGLAEITWRWSFGATATTLIGLSFLEYLDTLPVTRGEVFLLKTHHPFLIARALGHILAGSAPRVVAAAIVLGLGLAMIWIVTASWGRGVTLRSLLRHYWAKEPEKDFPFSTRSLMGLNFFRAVAVLAAKVGCVGAFVLGGMATSDKDPSPGSATLIFFAVILLVLLVWGAMNWFLSLASVFVVLRNQDTFGAMATAVGFFRERIGGVLAVSFWFGLAHGVAWVAFNSVVAFPMAFASVLPPGIVLGGVLLVMLLYFAVVDFLYIGRLGAYVWILEGPAIEPVQEILPEPPRHDAPPEIPPIEILDPNELILSDLPVT